MGAGTCLFSPKLSSRGLAVCSPAFFYSTTIKLVHYPRGRLDDLQKAGLHGGLFLVSYVRGQEAKRVLHDADRLGVGGESSICAELGAERETTFDLICGLVTAFRVFVSGLSTRTGVGREAQLASRKASIATRESGRGRTSTQHATSWRERQLHKRDGRAAARARFHPSPGITQPIESLDL